MDKLTVELTEKQKQNLLIFLNRVQLSGAEVPAYIEIVQAVNKLPPSSQLPLPNKVDN